MDQKKLDDAISRLVADLAELNLGVTALLYGSAARGDWEPARSDVNLMLIVDDASPGALRRLAPALASWHASNLTPPLLLSRSEWSRAVDVFPIEITDMQASYRLLHGEDLVHGVVVAQEDLRRALEADLRGKLLRLRQAYVRFADAPITLGGFAAASISALLVLLRCTAVLTGRGSAKNVEAIVASLDPALGPHASVLIEVAAHRREREWSCAAETFVQYLETVQYAVELVDQYQPGAE